MSDLATNLDTVNPSQAGKEIRINSLVDAESPSSAFGRHDSATSGLVWGYYGGKIIVDGVITSIANGTLTLADNSTNYVEADRAGTVTSNTAGLTAGRNPLYRITTASGAQTNYLDMRCLFVAGTPILSLSVAGSSNVTLTQPQADCEIFELTGALTGNINVIVPIGPQVWIVHNNTTGAFTLTVKTTSGTGVAVTQGSRGIVYADGTNVVDALSDPTNAKPQVIAFAATVTPDVSISERVIVGAMTANMTVAAPLNPRQASELCINLSQDATGGRVITWNSVFKKAADGAGTANQRACAYFQFDGTNWLQQGNALAWFS